MDAENVGHFGPSGHMIVPGWRWAAKLANRRQEIGTRPPPSVQPSAVAPERLKWTPALVKRFWDAHSQTRLVEFNFAKQAGRSLMIAIDHLLPRDGRVLDFGAGDGELVRLLVEQGLKVAAYEPSEDRRAKLNALLANYPGFLGVVDACSAERFDVAIMSEVIEHILDEELEDSLNLLANLIKPGSLLIVTTPNNEDLELGMAYCPVSNTLFHRFQHVRSFSRESLCSLLRRFGFDEIVTHHVGFDDNIFGPWDDDAGAETPDYIIKLRTNEPARIGSEASLLYIGRRHSAQP